MSGRFDMRLGVLAVAAALVAACGGDRGGAPTADVGSGNLTGAGATFPEPFYTRAFYQYSQKYTKVSINYQAIGSGGGIQQFTKGTVDFGASDVPMTTEEVAAAGGPESVVQLPTTLGVVSIAYNLPEVPRLQVDGALLVGIFEGSIKRWNDPALLALNGGAKLPAKDITVVHRADASGTTYAFTDYLGKQAGDWKPRVGVSKSVQWPVGIAAPQNNGVANAIKQTDGAIGYVELAYVVQAKMQQAFVKNRAGKFLQASIEGATAAAAKKPSVNSTDFSITDQEGDSSYPLTTFSWALLKKSQADTNKGRAVVYLWRWVVTEGQQYGKELQYAPLPRDVADFAIAQLKTVTLNGAPVLK